MQILVAHFLVETKAPHYPSSSFLLFFGEKDVERAGLSDQGESRAAPGFLFSLIFHYSPKHVFTDSDFKASFPKNVTFTSRPWTFSLFFFFFFHF